MKFSVDSIMVRDNRVFAYGWAFDSSVRIAALELRLMLVDGSCVSLPISREKERVDVAATFPDLPNARFSGWLVYGAWSGPAMNSIFLAGELKNGEAFSFPIVDEARSAVAKTMSRLSHLVHKVRVFRYRGAADFLRKAREVMARNLRRGESGLVDLPTKLRRALQTAGQERFALVLDHSMGGGASHYSKAWVSQRLKERPLVLVLSFDIPSLRYTLDLVGARGVQQRLTFFGEPATALAAADLVDEVLYNDAVSFPRPDEVPGWLMAFRSLPGTTLTMVVHDYLVVCPSQFLLNDKGRFCGVPDSRECQRCLPRNSNEFAKLFPSHDMPVWRQYWGTALARADQVICFSESSRDLLQRAYPALDGSRIRVEPHKVAGFDRHPAIKYAAPLHVGVVGSIGWHKGAGIIEDLAVEIQRRQIPVKITVIGTLDAHADASVVRTTGGFSHEDLPHVINETGANLFLLPSICPETFSYVTHELMAMQVPVVCFDFGAPADSIGSYRLGRVVPRTTSADLLDDLLQFHHEMAIEHMVQA